MTMINALVRNISRICKEHHLAIKEIDSINQNILKRLNDSQKIHVYLKKHITYLIEKYDINHHEIYLLEDDIWEEIMFFKQNNPQIVISMTCNRKRMRV